MGQSGQFAVCFPIVQLRQFISGNLASILLNILCRASPRRTESGLDLGGDNRIAVQVSVSGRIENIERLKWRSKP